MMKGPALKPEWRRFADTGTGAEILQWTSASAMHHHFYFTNRTVSPEGTEGYFVSYRNGYPNIFSIDLAEGVLHQISDRVDINPFSPAACPRSHRLYASARDTVWTWDSESGEERPLAHLGCPRLGNCSLSADGHWLAIGARYDDYCELNLIDTKTGAIEVITRQKEVGHIQFCPSDPHLLLYSGPPDQRLWLIDTRERKPRLLYPQTPDQWIVHESWRGDGSEILFPHWPYALRTIRPDGSGLRTVVELNVWHVCGDPTGKWAVADTNHPDRGLVLIDLASGDWTTLCQPNASQRGTQWTETIPAKGAGIDTSIIRSLEPEQDPPPSPEDAPSTYGPQWSHPHPTWSPDARSIIYTSDGFRWSHVFSVAVSTRS